MKQSTAAPDAARLQGARWPSAPELLAVFDGSSVMTGPARARRSEADVARRGVDWLGVSGGGTVAAAIVRCWCRKKSSAYTPERLNMQRPEIIAMSESGQSLPKWLSAPCPYSPDSDELRTSLVVRFVPILLQKSKIEQP